MAELLTIGEPMVLFASNELDVSLDRARKFTKYSAGAELNVAVGVARLGHQIEYLSAVGNDPFGSYLRRELITNGISTTYLDTDSNHQTGFYLKQLVSTGDPEIAYFRRDSAAAHLDPALVSQIDLSQLKLAHLSGIFAALSAHDLAVIKRLNQRLNDGGITVTFDPNLRPALWTSHSEMVRVTNQLAAHADIVIPGIKEAIELTGLTDPTEIARFYFHQSVITRIVVVKVGTKGAVIVTRGGRQVKVMGYQIPAVVDTVGAGDGFVAGVVTALLEGLPIEQAARRGCAVGALAVMSHGDNDGYPTPMQLARFYQQYSGGRISEL